MIAASAGTIDTALLLSGVVALGIAAQWLAWYLKQPSILFLLLIGIIIGPVSAFFAADSQAFFNPDIVLGADLLFPFISLGVAIILFEGSLTLEFDEIKQHGKVVQMLVSVGVLVTIAVVALSTYLIFEVDPLIALLFGSLVCVTGPTVIMPLLRSVRPNKTISNILKWEGIIIDPVGAIAVVLVYEYIISGGEANGLLLFGEIVVVASIIGMFGAWVLAELMKRHMIPEYLRNVFTLAFVLLLFSISNHIEHESGLLAVTVMGVALANWKGFPRDHILEFNESLTVLLISVLFIVLAARVELESLLGVGFKGLLLLAIVMFVARPLWVWASSIGSNLKTTEKLMISWIGPRGIVAAAISSLFAIRLLEQPVVLKGAELLVPLVFLIIIGTVLIQGLGAKLVGNLLGVREPESNGVLIVGSNPIALLIAESLKDQGFEVLVAHNNYTNIAKARMSGLRTYFGNPVSDHADNHLDLIGIGHLFAMSTDKEMNTLSELHYRHEFGEQKIYRLKFSDDKSKGEREEKQSNFKSRWLFGKDVTYTKLASMRSKKARIKITNITDSYSFAQYRADNKQFVPLYTINKEGHLKVITDSFDNVIAVDHKLVALVIEDEVQPKEVDVTKKQLQARARADAEFEKTAKPPERRKQKELVGTADTTLIDNADPFTVAVSKALFNDSTTGAKVTLLPDSEEDTTTDSIAKIDPSQSTVKNTPNKNTQNNNTLNKATPKPREVTKQTIESSTNGNSQAPKKADGTLDPKRLPDNKGSKDKEKTDKAAAIKSE